MLLPSILNAKKSWRRVSTALPELRRDEFGACFLSGELLFLPLWKCWIQISVPQFWFLFPSGNKQGIPLGIIKDSWLTLVPLSLNLQSLRELDKLLGSLRRWLNSHSRSIRFLWFFFQSIKKKTFEICWKTPWCFWVAWNRWLSFSWEWASVMDQVWHSKNWTQLQIPLIFNGNESWLDAVLKMWSQKKPKKENYSGNSRGTCKMPN